MTGTLTQRVAGLLAGLGDTPDQVAAKLADIQVFGVRMSAFGCPLAVGLCRATGQPPGRIAVTRRRILIYPDGQALPDSVPAPEPVAAFVAAIDNGRYRHLLEPSDPDRWRLST
jgi:hypothetical protein